MPGQGDEHNELDATRIRLVWVPIVGLGLWIAFGLAPATISWLFGKQDWETLGAIGDNFGAANALFTSIVLLAALYAVAQGHRTIELQKAELKLTRKELRRTADAQIESVEQQRRLIQSQVMAALMDELGRNQMQEGLILIEDESRRRYVNFYEQFPQWAADVASRKAAAESRANFHRLMRACRRLFVFVEKCRRLQQRGELDVELVGLVLDSSVRANLDFVEKIQNALDRNYDKTAFDYVRGLT